MSKQEKDGHEKVITDYSLIFGQVYALKISLHGYIIVVGKSPMREVARYLIYSLNGDLLKMAEEFLEIKSVFLNTREDLLIIAMNYTSDNGQRQGNLRVLNLYGLSTVSDLSDVCYTLTRENLASGKHNARVRTNRPLQTDKLIPTIQAMAVSKGERNINIFFVK